MKHAAQLGDVGSFIFDVKGWAVKGYFFVHAEAVSKN